MNDILYKTHVNNEQSQKETSDLKEMGQGVKTILSRNTPWPRGLVRLYVRTFWKLQVSVSSKSTVTKTPIPWVRDIFYHQKATFGSMLPHLKVCGVYSKFLKNCWISLAATNYFHTQSTSAGSRSPYRSFAIAPYDMKGSPRYINFFWYSHH